MARSMSDRIDAILPLAPRDYLILFALVDGARHGHAILRGVESAAGGVLLDPANLYRSLRKLERDELVSEVKTSARNTDGPPRRFFELTRLGRAVLAAEAHRLTQLADAARRRKLVSASSNK
jgi:DNA-binding PadR family transcriptional regulator